MVARKRSLGRKRSNFLELKEGGNIKGVIKCLRKQLPFSTGKKLN